MGFESTFSVDNWHKEARTTAIRDRIKTRRWGMRVTVYDDSDPSLNGDYVLSYNLVNTNRQSNDNWLKVADIGSTWGGGGGAVTASNGLTAVGSDVRLGGTLDDFTTIEVGANALNLQATDSDMYCALNLQSFNVAFEASDLVGNFHGFALTPTNVQIYGYDPDFNQAEIYLAGSPPVLRLQINNQDDGSQLQLNEFGLVFTTSRYSADTYAEFEILNDSEITILSGGPGFTALAGIYIHTANTIDFIAETFQLNGVASSDPTNEFFRADGTWAPASGGGGATADNGLTETAGNIQLGGPLLQNTLINGDFNLSIGQNGNRINFFQVYTDGGITLSTNFGSGNSTISFDFGGTISQSVDQRIFTQHSSAKVYTQTLEQKLKKQTETDQIGTFISYTNEAGNTAAGFGMLFDYYLSNGSSNEVEAMQDRVFWTVTTNGSEQTTWAKRLKVAGAPTDVMSIATSAIAPTIRTTLAGLLILSSLPTASAGLPAGSVWNNSGVLNIV